MVIDDSYTCGKHNIIYRDIDSACCTSENNVTLCANYPQIKKKTIKLRKINHVDSMYSWYDVMIIAPYLCGLPPKKHRALA